MRFFISAGEPSGDLHGANLVRALKARQPGVGVTAFGGDRLAAAGAEVVYPLCDHAVMGFTGAIAAVPRLWSVYRLFKKTLQQQRPDAVVLIDYPGFHWWLAHAAKAAGIPVVYFVPPQIWAWATHRVKRMQRNVDHVLCSLPFEKQWYAERGVQAEFVGHPFFDEVRDRALDDDWCEEQRAKGGRIVALLPGSRNKEVKRNAKTLLRVAKITRARHTDTRFLLACFKESQAAWVRDLIGDRELPIEVHVGRTPEIMSLAHCCAAVSGSVSLELLYHNVPTVITYRVGTVFRRLAEQFKQVPYITLVNLLAGRELYPEFLSDKCEGRGIADELDRWLRNEPARQLLKFNLRQLLAQVGQPGACGRAADYLLNLQPQQQRLAA